MSTNWGILLLLLSSEKVYRCWVLHLADIISTWLLQMNLMLIYNRVSCFCNQIYSQFKRPIAYAHISTDISADKKQSQSLFDITIPEALPLLLIYALNLVEIRLTNLMIYHKYFQRYLHIWSRYSKYLP